MRVDFDCGVACSTCGVRYFGLASLPVSVAPRIRSALFQEGTHEYKMEQSVCSRINQAN